MLPRFSSRASLAQAADRASPVGSLGPERASPAAGGICVQPQKDYSEKIIET
jgi:hypothetical protein